MTSSRIFLGDCRSRLRELAPGSVQTCVTSPPYWNLRDYDADGQIGLETDPDAFVDELVQVFREVRRVLADDGTLWLNLGDTYVGGRTGGIGTTGLTSGRNHEAVRHAAARIGGTKHRGANGLKPKDLVGIPWMVAFALRADGWFLRAENIWWKPNPMPESVLDRTTRAHEQVFLLSKSRRYYYDADAVRTPLAPKTFTAHGSKRLAQDGDALGAVKAANFSRDVPERRPRVDADGKPVGSNLRSVWEADEDELEQFRAWKRARLEGRITDVWSIATQPLDLEDYGIEHTATFPPKLVEPCIRAGSRVGDRVLDPFSGTGTVGVVAQRLQRSFDGVELNPEWALASVERLRAESPLLADVELVDFPEVA